MSQNLVEALVEEALLVVRQAPARHDRTAARDDPRGAPRGQRHVGQPHAGMDGEVVHALLGLLDQGVLEHLPIQLVGLAADLLQCLIDRNGTDRDRGVAENPAPDVVDVATRREVHHRVAAPADRPDQLLHLVGNARGHGGIADVGVDLHQEVAPDDDRLQLRVVDVGGDDGAAARDLVADELRRDEGGDGGAEILAVGPAFLRARQHLPAAEVFAVGDVDHLLGDDAGAGELVLRDVLAGAAGQHTQLGRAGRDEALALGAAVVLGLDVAGSDGSEAAPGDPRPPHRRQPGFQVDVRAGIGVGAGAVIGAIGLLARRRVERDLAERHADVGPGLGRGVDLARARDRSGGHAGRAGGRLRLDRHGCSP